MADELLGSARFEIRGDASGATQAANQANSAFAQMEQIVATNWWGLQNLGAAFAALPTAIAAGTGVAINYARQWEDAMFDVARTSGQTGVALDDIEASLFRVARTTPIATTELAALASEGAALGIANDNLGEFSRIMGMLIASTDLTSEGVENIARVLNIMQVPVEEYENFASALIETGRNTAATEQDIISAAKRLATIGSVAGATSDQVIAMGAAIRSLGPESEAGSSAVNKTITDMANAIGTGSEELEHFAGIAGMSSEQFAEVFRGNAYDALAAYITGLGRLPDAMVGVQAAFEATNADGVRQQQALATLANGTRDVRNEQRDLNAILALSARAWAENAVLAEIEEKRMNTLSGQMQVMKNAVFEAGASFGRMLLPAVKQVVSVVSVLAEVLSNVVRGFQMLPGPLRGLVSGFGLLTFGIMALVAGLLLVGPRIVIALGALRQLKGVADSTKLSADGLTASTNMLGQAQTAAAGKAQHLASINRSLAASFRIATTGAMGETAANSQSIAVGQQKIGMLAGMRTAYGNLSIMTRRAIASTIAMTGAMIGLTIWMARAGAAAQKVEQQRANMLDGLKAELRETALLNSEQGRNVDAMNAAALAHLRQQQIYKQTADAARSLNMDMNDLNRVLTGQASMGESQTIINDIWKQADEGSAAARKLLTNMKDLYGAYAPVRDATKQNTLALSDYTAQSEDAAEATKNLANELEQQAQAHIDYIGALFSAREAQLSVKDAEEGLREAREALNNQSQDIQKAERDLASARRDHQDALEDVRDAEVDLARARQRGIDELAEAESSLADSRDSYLDNLDKIRETEEELAELREGPSVRELTKATNDLRDAQLSLLDANRKVSDAEWYLQYIREQGGSNRDIEDAEFALLEARQEVANQQESVNEAEGELAELRDEAARQREIVALERDLAAARRDSANILREIRQNEQEVADLRQRVASDDFYREAQNTLNDAHRAVENAALSAQDAEQKLADTRSENSSAVRDLERAQLTYEQSLYRLAEANTSVQRQTALMRGETWNAGREAATLASELGKIAGNIPDANARQRMSEFMNILANAPAVPDVGEWEAGVNDALSGMDVTPGFEEAFRTGAEELSFPETFGDNLGSQDWWGPVALMIGGALGPVLGRALSAAFTAAATAIVSSPAAMMAAVTAIAAGWGYFITQTDWGKELQIKFQELQEKMKEWGGDLISGLIDGMDEFGTRINEFIRRKFTEWVIDPVKRLFGISSPSTVFHNIGIDIIQGLLNGLGSISGRVLTFLGGIGTGIINTFAGAGSWLVGAGSNILIGLLNGLGSLAGEVLNFFAGLPDNIWRILEHLWSAGGTMIAIGKNIVIGMWNGLTSMGDWLWDNLWKWIKSVIPDPIEKALGIDSPSKVAAMLGKYVGQGLGEGILSEKARVAKAAEELAQAAIPDIERMAADYNLDYMLSSDVGIGKFDSRAASARIPTGTGGTTISYGDTVTINAETNASPEDIVNEYVWNKRVRARG